MRSVYHHLEQGSHHRFSQMGENGDKIHVLNSLGSVMKLSGEENGDRETS